MALEPHAEEAVVVHAAEKYLLASHVGHGVQGALPDAENVEPATQAV